MLQYTLLFFSSLLPFCLAVGEIGGVDSSSNLGDVVAATRGCSSSQKGCGYSRTIYMRVEFLPSWSELWIGRRFNAAYT